MAFAKTKNNTKMWKTKNIRHHIAPCHAIAMANVIAFMTIYYNTTKVIDINYVFPKQYNKNNNNQTKSYNNTLQLSMGMKQKLIKNHELVINQIVCLLISAFLERRRWVVSSVMGNAILRGFQLGKIPKRYII